MVELADAGGYKETAMERTWKKSVLLAVFINLIFLAVFVTGQACAISPDGEYWVGTGIYDITGPAAETTMGGYAITGQKTSGISTRLWARAFIIGDGDQRVVFVSADTWAFDSGAKQELIKKLKADPELSQYYTAQNICVSATHTHSSVGGFSHYFLYNAPNGGFVPESMFAVVAGIYEAIKRAHDNLQAACIYVNQGELSNTGWNRSESAYRNNPQQERDRYSQNTDAEMLLLKFMGENGAELGMINWFAIHADTIGPENTLISGDSKGHAAYQFEKAKGTDYREGEGFVAAFAQADSGDSTPNPPFTKHIGSAAWAAQELSISVDEALALGFPLDQALGEADIKKNPILKLITDRQLSQAEELYNNAEISVSGSIDFRHEYVDFSDLYVDSERAATCPGGMGASYTGGSPSDNPSPYPLFPLGVTTDNLQEVDSLNYRNMYRLLGLLPYMAGFLGMSEPMALSPAYKTCQEPKPVILPTGLMSMNVNHYPMTPQVLPVQILKIGNVAILALPFEVTTMSGRRLKEAGLKYLASSGVDYVAMACLANGYGAYMATKEEYQKQMFEGAGTFFGPNQLSACIQEIEKLADAITRRQPVDAGPQPQDMAGKIGVSTQGRVSFDRRLWIRQFGLVAVQPSSSFTKGETVKAVFWGAHPRNTLTYMMNRGELRLYPFAQVEQNINGQWVSVVFDWDPELVYSWSRDEQDYSKCAITWDTRNAVPGQYRIHHRGHWKRQIGTIEPYDGYSSVFNVI